MPPPSLPPPAEDAAASRRSRRRRPAAFYAPALDPTDRSDLADAGAVAGLDQEIAVLRLRLRRLLSEQPDEIALIVRTLELLVRAVGTAARLHSDDADAQLEQISAGVDGMVSLLINPSDDFVTPDPSESPERSTS